MNQFRVPNGLKAIKKTSSGLIGSFNIKKLRNFLRALFFIKLCTFFAFLSQLETSQFSYRGSFNENLLYNQMKPNEQKNRFQGIDHVFLNSTLSFRNFN